MPFSLMNVICGGQMVFPPQIDEHMGRPAILYTFEGIQFFINLLSVFFFFPRYNITSKDTFFDNATRGRIVSVHSIFDMCLRCLACMSRISLSG